MAILIMFNQADPKLLKVHLKLSIDCPEVRIYPDVGDKDDIKCIILWKQDVGLLDVYPNLRMIASYGAGIENIINDPSLPKDVPVTRFIDDTLSNQMAEFVLGSILNYRLNLTLYRELQASSNWSCKNIKKGKNVTILGMGELGKTTAKLLHLNGYAVSGWSRSEKKNQSIKNYFGNKQLNLSLVNADIVVCLLPLTPETKFILNKNLFNILKKGAYLINVGRGDHLVEEDLLDALYHEKLSGALLDVYSKEPLPTDHIFWKHPKIHMTPHISSPTDKEKVARQILDNYARIKVGEEPINQVNPKRFY